MGLRIMHYCIATLISQQIEIENTNEFILGGITPDVQRQYDFKLTYTEMRCRIGF